MSEIIPTSITATTYTQTTTLDGRDFILRFSNNQRDGLWYMDIGDQDDVPIASGLKLVAEGFPLRRLTDPRTPDGFIIVKDLESNDGGFDTGRKLIALDPGLGELGERVVLVYVTAAERAVLLAAG